MSNKKVAFSQDDADRIYNELKDLAIKLDADPLIFGPKRLNKKLSDARGMLDRCERIFLDISQKLHAAKRSFRIESVRLDLKKKELFANDPETRAGRSVSDREAIAAGKLTSEMATVNHLDVMVQDLDAVLTVVKAKRSDLRDTQARLRDQIRLCQEEIGLGAQWGSRTPVKGPDLSNGAAAADDDGFEDLLEGVEGEVHLEQSDSSGQIEGSLLDDDEEEDDEQPEEETPQTEANRQEAEEGAKGADKASEGGGEDAGEPFTEEPAETPPPDLPEPSGEEIDLDEALPPSSNQEAVDSFLDNLEEPSPKPDKKASVAELDVDGILSTFENLD